VINVSNKLSGEMFTAADEKLLTTLASQAAVAIENAYLVGELQEKKESLEAALRKVELLEKAKSHLNKFVPQSVQKLIEDNPDMPELDKQDKDVSVLFLDIAGYTRISATLDQAKVNYLIERYFSSFLDDIHGNEGDINETAGDGLMIIFQNPDSTTHALQAARTALAIRNKTQQINTDLQGQYEPVQVNIGINSGLASVGSAKFEGITGTRWTYTASGMVTNLAARIAAFATGGSILASEKTICQLSDQFLWEDLGEHRFKNLREPVQIFRLIGLKGEQHEQENPHCR
jgi:class 3 adenylate cyclase